MLNPFPGQESMQPISHNPKHFDKLVPEVLTRFRKRRLFLFPDISARSATMTYGVRTEAFQSLESGIWF
jgi:hypothetical protein